MVTFTMKTEEHARRFNQWAPTYATAHFPGREECIRTVLQRLAPDSDDILLDVGCGPGAQLIALAPKICAGYGVDPAEEMIRRAQHEAAACSNLHFLIGSAQHLPSELHHAGITKIYSNYALHHLNDEDKEQAIRSLAALLPENGRLILGDLMFSDAPENHRALYDTVGYVPENDTPSTVAALEEIFTRAGLQPDTRLLTPLTAVLIGTRRAPPAGKP